MALKISRVMPAISMLAALFVSNAAQATYPNGDAIADAGTYSPIVLGENITLNACGSTFAGYSICNLPSTNKFGIEWFILKKNEQYNYDEWLKQYTFHQGQVAPNLEMTLATGEGADVFITPGTYFIGLHLISYGDTIALPGGGYAQGGDSDWSWSGTFTVSEGGGSPVTPPSSVPEPMSALLLIPGLAFMARRSRRKTASATV